MELSSRVVARVVLPKVEFLLWHRPVGRVPAVVLKRITLSGSYTDWEVKDLLLEANPHYEVGRGQIFVTSPKRQMGLAHALETCRAVDHCNSMRDFERE